jgi:hypothetical protein
MSCTIYMPFFLLPYVYLFGVFVWLLSCTMYLLTCTLILAQPPPYSIAIPTIIGVSPDSLCLCDPSKGSTVKTIPDHLISSVVCLWSSILFLFDTFIQFLTLIDLWEWLLHFNRIRLQASSASHWKWIDRRSGVCAEENVWDSRARSDESLHGERETIRRARIMRMQCVGWYLYFKIWMKCFYSIIFWSDFMPWRFRQWTKDVTCWSESLIRPPSNSSSTSRICRYLKNQVTCELTTLGLKWIPSTWYVRGGCC